MIECGKVSVQNTTIVDVEMVPLTLLELDFNTEFSIENWYRVLEGLIKVDGKVPSDWYEVVISSSVR